MTLVRRILSLIVVLALVLTACGDASSEVVGTVGDTEVTVGDVAELFESETLPIDSTLRDAIFALLAREVLIQGLEEDFGEELDHEGVDALYEELVAEMEAQGATPEEYLGIPDASTQMIRFNAEIGVIRQQVIDAVVTDQETIDAFFSEPAAITTVCVRHVLVETEEEAESVKERIEGGEDFGEVADELSLDTATPGGDLGCSIASRYVAEFAEATLVAEPGEVFGPVQTQFGYHILIVDDRTAPTEQQLIDDPLAFLSEDELNTLWGQWLNEKLDEAEVTVDPKYGTWTDVGILPPEDDSPDDDGS